MCIAITAIALTVFVAFLYRDGYSISLKNAELIKISSPAFEDSGAIPQRHTRRGEDISPEINVEGLSPKAKSIAIVMVDLDFPPILGKFSHWVAWNIPVVEKIPEGIPKGEQIDDLGGMMQGNAFGKHSYGGPKPPKGAKHRYRFTVYVLDTMINLPADSDKKGLLQAIDGHVLQYGVLVGVYE